MKTISFDADVVSLMTFLTAVSIPLSIRVNCMRRQFCLKMNIVICSMINYAFKSRNPSIVAPPIACT